MKFLGVLELSPQCHKEFSEENQSWKMHTNHLCTLPKEHLLEHKCMCGYRWSVK